MEHVNWSDMAWLCALFALWTGAVVAHDFAKHCAKESGFTRPECRSKR